MSASNRRGCGPEAGLSLSEVLVALTIMSLAGIVALFLYDAARQSFHKGENAAEQQQSVRIAFDRLSSDLRLAGYNANPDGDTFRIDEAIEAAYDTALVLRADFDAEDETEDDDNESALAGGAHPVESVGNDEIVAYVLAKPDGSSPDTLTFDADVKDVPRDGVSETVSIPHVALVQNDPPYTLYRITLNRDAGTWGSAGFVNQTPLLDNVRAVTFRYFDSVGPLSAFDLTSASEDVGGADSPTARRIRAGIRRVEVDVEGLTRDPDLKWEDAGDPLPATKRFRKFELRGDITPRNLGKKGMQDFGWDVTPPSRPGAPTLVPGHCRGLFVKWPANPVSDGVTGYRVLWRAAGQAPGSRTVAARSVYISGLEHALEYYVSVQAVDAAGNWSPPSDERSDTLTNVNDPRAPLGLLASSEDPYEIRLSWNAVRENTTSDPYGDPRTPAAAIRDLLGYRILRGLAANFAEPCPPRVAGDPCSGSTVVVADARATGAIPAPAWVDRAAVACRTHFYRVEAWDACDRRIGAVSEAAAEAPAAAAPAKPEGGSATASSGVVRLTWDPVTVDVDGHPIFIDQYDIERCEGGAGDCVYLRADTASGAFDDFAPVPTPVYRVSARNDCESGNASEWSDAVMTYCGFSGRVEIVSPRSGWLAGATSVHVRVVAGSDTYVGGTLQIRRVADGSVQVVALGGPGPTWTSYWTPPAAGGYLVKAVIGNTGGCNAAAAAHVYVGN